MMFRIEVTREAARDIDQSFVWWAENRDREQAIRWYTDIFKELQSLKENPERFPISDETDLCPTGLRELYYGLGRRPTHRVIFTIVDDTVRVLCVRHLSRRPLIRDDLGT